eukprot:EG_transcript_27072
MVPEGNPHAGHCNTQSIPAPQIGLDRWLNGQGKEKREERRGKQENRPRGLHVIGRGGNGVRLFDILRHVAVGHQRLAAAGEDPVAGPVERRERRQRRERQ